MDYYDEIDTGASPAEARSFKETFKGQITVLGSFVLLIWLIEIADIVVFHGKLDNWGIRPRTLSGLWGILFMPLLHDGIGHLLANTIPFLFMGWLVMLRRMADFFLVSAIAILVGGLGVWLFAPSGTNHLGASGLVFGYFGYLLTRALFERSLASMSLALIVILLYGSFIWGVLPLRPGVSWQAHLFGFASGALAAYWLARRE